MGGPSSSPMCQRLLSLRRRLAGAPNRTLRRPSWVMRTIMHAWTERLLVTLLGEFWDTDRVMRMGDLWERIRRHERHTCYAPAPRIPQCG